ncbi:MAG: ABC transporter ATP-binding protein [Clostridia bacterium]|nr:ABC transporter ATP-binding protein [Clostridia bacterium]
MKEILTLDKVGLIYHSPVGETQAVKNMSFSVAEGEFVAMIGPSGCGKSTVLNMIAGLIKPSEGKIKLNGEEVSSAAGKFGYMLQRDELFPWRTIRKNVTLPLEIKRIKNKENEDYAFGLLKKYGLKEFADHYPDQLSGGMRQRVALIRTLAAKPDLLLLDEPFSALDYQTRLSVCEDVFRIIREENKTSVLVTHDISEAVSVADRVILLSSRPAAVRKEYTVDFDKDLSPLKRREDPRFRDWFELLWRDLNDENER